MEAGPSGEPVVIRLSRIDENVSGMSGQNPDHWIIEECARVLAKLQLQELDQEFVQEVTHKIGC